MREHSEVYDRIGSIIRRFEESAVSYDIVDVSDALGRMDLAGLSEEEALLARSIVDSFMLDPTYNRESPWNTHFAPIASGTREDGTIVCRPDATQLAPMCIDYWEEQARSLKHPVLVARYADMSWDLATLVEGRKKNPEMAHLAIEAYIECGNETMCSCPHSRLRFACRALDLSRQIKDVSKENRAVENLLELQRQSVLKGEHWWIVPDKFINCKKTALTNVQEKSLIDGLEKILKRSCNTSNNKEFDPNDAKTAADLLVSHYNRKKKFDDVKRIKMQLGRAEEHFASLASPMLATIKYRDAEKSYQDAGSTTNKNRARVLKEKSMISSKDEMVSIGIDLGISGGDIERDCSSLMDQNLKQTLLNISKRFLLNYNQIQQIVENTDSETVLSRVANREIWADNCVAAKIGTVDDGMYGNIVHTAAELHHLHSLFMCRVFDLLSERHNPSVDDFVDWINRLNVFDDTTLLRAGLEAWRSGDLVAAMHILVPQVEYGFRGIARDLGIPTSKSRPKSPSEDTAISMGDFLFNEDIRSLLGEDLIIHFSSLYSDRRGYNVRNNIAHGLIQPANITEGLTNAVIHSLMIFGCWRDLVPSRSAVDARLQKPEVRKDRKRSKRRRRKTKTTTPGFRNRNDQTVIRGTDILGTDHNQYVYELKCERCGFHYGANGSDIHLRKCPRCGGGAPGLDYQ